MEEKKYLNMPTYLCIALSILLFPFGIVTLAVEGAKVEKEDKQAIILGFIYAAISTIFAILGLIFSGVQVLSIIVLILNLSFTALWVYQVVTAFMNKFFKVPVLWALAGKFVGNDSNAKQAPAEEKAEEKAKEEAPAEEKAE